jgi:hypothetical protein
MTQPEPNNCPAQRSEQHARPHRHFPCAECPWRTDVAPGQFSAQRYADLRNTAGEPGREADLNAPWFACHKSPEQTPEACAGWLAACGVDHLGVRLAVALGHLPAETLHPGSNWPQLYDSYAVMARAQASGTGDRRGKDVHDIGKRNP